jgi:WD40 repeat protein
MNRILLPFYKLTASVTLATAFLTATTQAQISPQIEWTFQDSNLVGAISTVDFSPNGNLVAYGAEFSRYIQVRRVSDGALLRTFSGSASMGIENAKFSPNGSQLGATWSITGWTLAILGGAETFGAASTSPVLTTNDHDDFVTDLAWSPNSQSILTGSLEGKADLVDATTGAQLLEVDHGSGITSVAFSPNGLYFATGGAFGDVSIWETSSGTLVRSITAHLGSVSDLEFHADNIHLATGGGDPIADSDINIWDFLTGAFVGSHRLHTEGVTGLAFFSGGNLLMSSDLSSTIRISQSFGPSEVATIDLGHGPRVSALDLHEGAQRFAYGTDSGWIVLAKR